MVVGALPPVRIWGSFRVFMELVRMDRFCRLQIGFAAICLFLVAANGQPPSDGGSLAMPSSVDAAASRLSSELSTWEWLGPLAPVALSPFFGLACLSGIATYGPDWLQQRSHIFHESGPLSNPILFWSMLVLTIITSLPRLTKVSKPIALFANRLETYSVAIIFLVMRFLPGLSETNSGVGLEHPLLLAGFSMNSLPYDLLMGSAAAINIVVINLIKSFFELLIWFVPWPALDALFEATSKGLAAGMMGIYCYSPVLATVINLMMLGASLCVFQWLWRLQRYYQDIGFTLIFRNFFPSWYRSNPDQIQGYLAEPWAGFPTYTPVVLVKNADGWKLTIRGWIRRIERMLHQVDLQSVDKRISILTCVDSKNEPPLRLLRRKDLDP